MALIFRFDSEFGSIFENAYGKVDTVSINYSEQNTSINFAIYVSKDARLNNKLPIRIQKYNVLPDEFLLYFDLNEASQLDNNLIKQSYIYLKDKEDYINSIDDI